MVVGDVKRGMDTNQKVGVVPTKNPVQIFTGRYEYIYTFSLDTITSIVSHKNVCILSTLHLTYCKFLHFHVVQGCRTHYHLQYQTSHDEIRSHDLLGSSFKELYHGILATLDIRTILRVQTIIRGAWSQHPELLCLAIRFL